MNQENECVVWVQTQAPAGNWVDYTGFNFNESPDEVITKARSHANWIEVHEERKTRLVIKSVEVIAQP